MPRIAIEASTRFMDPLDEDAQRALEVALLSVEVSTTRVSGQLWRVIRDPLLDMSS